MAGGVRSRGRIFRSTGARGFVSDVHSLHSFFPLPSCPLPPSSFPRKLPNSSTEQFANVQMGYTLVRILQKFERIEKYWSEAEQTMKSEIVLSPGKQGVRVGFCAPA